MARWGTALGRFLFPDAASATAFRGAMCARQRHAPHFFFSLRLDLRPASCTLNRSQARVAEMADALRSGRSVRKDVGVRIPPLVPPYPNP